MLTWPSAGPNFRIRIREIVSIVRHAEQLSLEASAKLDMRQGELATFLCRGANVLLCSHIEGFVEDIVKDIFAEAVRKKVDRSKFSVFLPYFFSRDLVENIRSTKYPDSSYRCVAELLKRDLSLWQDTGPFVVEPPADRIVSNFANPRCDLIYQLFSTIGYNSLKQDFARTLKAKALIIEQEIENIVVDRHKIAHGDHSLVMTPDTLINRTAKAYWYCHHVGNLTLAWFNA